MAGSCHETTLRTALAGGGDLTSNCSASPNPIILTDELVITAPTTIDGTNGDHPVTISGGGVTRILSQYPTGSSLLNNLTVQNGSHPVGKGAAIYARGTLIVTNSRFYSNTAEAGGAIAIQPGVAVTVTGSTLADNQATASGGGALYLRGSVSGSRSAFVSSSQFHHNTAATSGAPCACSTALSRAANSS